MNFAIVYDKNTSKIESMVVPLPSENINLENDVKLFEYQGIELFDMSKFNVDIDKMQLLLINRIK